MYWYHYTDAIYYGGGFDSLHAYDVIGGPIEYNGRLYGTKDNPVYYVYYRSGLLDQWWRVYPVDGAYVSNHYFRIFGHVTKKNYSTAVAKEIPGATISGKYRFYSQIASQIPCSFSIPCNYIISYADGTSFKGNSIQAITYQDRYTTRKYCGIVWKSVPDGASVTWGSNDDSDTYAALPAKSKNCVIDFGAAEQDIPAFILEWIEHNAEKVAQDSTPLTIVMKNPNGIRLETEEKYCDRDITVIPRLQTKTVTANGDVTAGSGYVGLSKVTVAIPDGVWESMQAGMLAEFGSDAESIVGTLAGCASLVRADLTRCVTLAEGMFRGCSSLTALILRPETVVTAGATACADTPIASGGGYIYVPAAQVAGYQAEGVWSAYAAQIRALEDYTTDGTITGTLDDTKI